VTTATDGDTSSDAPVTALSGGSAARRRRGAAPEVLFPSREQYVDVVTGLRDEGFETCADLCGVDYLTHPGRTLPDGVAAPEPSLASGDTLAELGGDWSLDLNGKQLTTPLKSWEDLGTESNAGPATYRKQFTASAAPAGKRLFLEIADVRDYARVKLNGKELEARAWQPYRWEVTDAVKPGANDLEVEVRASPGGRGGVGGRPPVAASPPASGLLGPVRLLAR